MKVHPVFFALVFRISVFVKRDTGYFLVYYNCFICLLRIFYVITRTKVPSKKILTLKILDSHFPSNRIFLTGYPIDINV